MADKFLGFSGDLVEPANGGGNAPIVFDLTEYYANFTQNVPITDEFIQAVLDFNVIFTQRVSNTESDWSWTTTESCIITALSIEDAENTETGEKENFIKINKDSNGIFGVAVMVKLINKELKFSYPS